MFIAQLLVIAKSGNAPSVHQLVTVQTKCNLSTWWTIIWQQEEMNYRYKAQLGGSLKIICFSERSQSQRTTYYIILFI